MLTLTVSRAYVRKLVDNLTVVRFLTANYPEILSEFQAFSVVEAL